jgi:hypothetical protein
MPITIEWYNEEKAISYMKFVGDWNWTEFYEATQKGYEMTDSVAHKVNVILDFTQTRGMLPPSAITHFKKAAENAHPRRGVVVLVSPRMILVKTILNVIQHIGKLATPILFASTVEGACDIINNSSAEKKFDTTQL